MLKAVATMASTILQILSPRGSKALSPICILTQSTSTMTVQIMNDECPLLQYPEPAYVSPYSQDYDDSNQRTRNQFRPRNANKGTTSYQLRQYAEATLGGGSLRKIVKLPEGEDENEWLAVNSKDFVSARLPCSRMISGGFLQSYQPSLWIDHRVLLATIMSRDESDG